MAGGIIGADAQHFGAQFLQVVMQIAKGTRFLRAARRVVFWVEVKNNRFPWRAESLIFVPSSAGREKSGALVPSSIQSCMACLAKIDFCEE